MSISTIKSPPPSIDGVIDGLSGLGTSVTTLAVLQARLATTDLRETSVRVVPALVATAVLMPLAFASFTGALFGLAFWLSSAFHLSIAMALGLAALAGLAVCLVLTLIAWKVFRAGAATFRRSREELERNLAWLGTVLTQSGR